MINHLIVLLDHNAPSFCCYHSGCKTGADTLMPLEVLQQTVGFAIRHRLSLNILCGCQPLPPAYEDVIDAIAHIRIVPLAGAGVHDDAVFIIDAGYNMPDTQPLDQGDLNNVILRAGKNNLGYLIPATRQLLGKFKRLNIVLTEPGEFDTAAFALYENQLHGLREIVEAQYSNGDVIEISAVSDRVFLTNMNNCNAGVDHLTVAPNGKFYLCPAFYYQDPDDHVGDVERDIDVRNVRLLDLNHAPICRNCDAYQCKRCVYLNRKLTSELNTPSHQQCVLAHLERNAARQLRNTLCNSHFTGQTPPEIPELNYLDPFELINNRAVDPQVRQNHFADLLAGPLENVPVRELLRQIHSLDQAMLAKLKALNHSPPE